jgi:hypothetical protein
MWDALRGKENTIFKNMLHITLSYVPQLTGACVIDLGQHCSHIYILPEPGWLKVTDNRVEGKPAEEGKNALGNHICTLHHSSAVRWFLKMNSFPALSFAWYAALGAFIATMTPTSLPTQPASTKIPNSSKAQKKPASMSVWGLSTGIFSKEAMAPYDAAR